MSKLKKLLVQRTEEERGLIGRLAKAIGVSDSVINKFKNISEKELDSFEILIQLVRILDENNELALMIDHSEGIDANNKTARYMLEYLAINRKTEALRNLLDRMKEVGNKESREWVSFYEILHKQLTDHYNVDYKQRIIEVGAQKANTTEMKVMSMMLNVYSHYQTDDYKSMMREISVIEGLLEGIKDNFIRKAYQARALEMKAYVCLTVNANPEEARAISKQVIELGVSKKYEAYANHTIGLSYLYESYEEGVKHLDRSIAIYREVESPTSEIDISEVEDTLEMFAAVWRKKIDFKIEQYSKLYSVYQGEKIELDGTYKDEAYKILVEGIQNSDFDQLMNALVEFVKKGDKFLTKLPMIELNKIGCNYNFINKLINFHD